jgi:GNAT superfamily N-acetyltransferase
MSFIAGISHPFGSLLPELGTILLRAGFQSASAAAHCARPFRPAPCSYPLRDLLLGTTRSGSGRGKAFSVSCDKQLVDNGVGVKGRTDPSVSQVRRVTIVRYVDSFADIRLLERVTRTDECQACSVAVAASRDIASPNGFGSRNKSPKSGEVVIDIRPLRYVRVRYDDVLVQPLLAQLASDYSRRYGINRQETEAQLRNYPATELEPPHGGMLIGLLDDNPVTGGGYRRFDSCTAELKRIWTHTRFRRLGYARELLIHLESEAAMRGYRRIRLETGSRQPEAESLYLSAGYTMLSGHRPNGDAPFPVIFVKAIR